MNILASLSEIINETRTTMVESTETNEEPVERTGARRRNIILGVILACAALAMYGSIFVRLSTNPLQ